ncbi:MAG TPA: VWA domain-containing protein, partial [Acidimicrobiales bacterium]|nr:VWA domain-containing protein [Acidimicrobiales bacterium]
MADGRGERLVVEFAAALRRGGLEVPPGTTVLFAEALATVGLSDRDLVYWAGLASLVRRPEDREAYDRVFAEFFECRLPTALPARPRQVTLGVDSGGDGEEPAGEGLPAEPETTLTLRYSATEVLREQDFSRYDEEEWAEARQLISAIRARAEQRRSRRLRPHARGRLDLARTVQMALSSDGEAIRRAFAAPADRPRRLVIIVDISGSMEPYARAFLRFAHAALVARPAGAVEVFVLSTRVSRITRQLSSRDPDEALAAA